MPLSFKPPSDQRSTPKQTLAGAPDHHIEVERDMVSQTARWLESFIVGFNICPFAKRELNRGSIRYAVAAHGSMQNCLEKLAEECALLDNEDTIETTLLIFAEGFFVFDDYLDLVEMANELLLSLGYEGVYQLASFHPEYCFDGEPASDPANYTNRSPYPMLHLIREASLEKALQFVDDPEAIPQRNIAFTREMGEQQLKAILAACKH